MSRLRPDVVIMDIRMPRIDGVEATRRLVGSAGEAPKVLVLTTFENDEYVYEALAGASGFLLKRAPTDEIVRAVHTVAAGDSLLFPNAIRRLATAFGGARRGRYRGAGVTDREQDVLRLMAAGRSTPRSRPSCSSVSRRSRRTSAASSASSARVTARRRSSPRTSRAS